MEEDEAAKVVGDDGFGQIVTRIISDYKSGNFPSVVNNDNDNDFEAAFKGYIKTIGKDLNLKGKSLFHPCVWL